MDSSMCTQKPLSLTSRFESPHPPLSHPGRLVRLLGPIILILLGTVNRLRNQFPMSYAIAPQFISHDLPGFSAMGAQQSPEEALCSGPVTLGLEKDINDLSILINRPPEVVLLVIDLNGPAHRRRLRQYRRCRRNLDVFASICGYKWHRI